MHIDRDVCVPFGRGRITLRVPMLVISPSPNLKVSGHLAFLIDLPVIRVYARACLAPITYISAPESIQVPSNFSARYIVFALFILPFLVRTRGGHFVSLRVLALCCSRREFLLL